MIEPAHLLVPPRVGSYGDEAVDLAHLAGWNLDPEQELAVDTLLSYGPGGAWAVLESGIVEARQNGKTARVLQPVTLFDFFMLPPDRIIWTAHLFKTSRDSFDDFVAAIERTPMLSRRTKKISYSHGEELIELMDGSTLEFHARSSGGGRGLKGKRVVFDEALILGATMMGALLPILSTRSNAQVNYGSSAAKADSGHLHKLLKRARAGSKSLAWIEWCAPGSWADPPCEMGARCPHTFGIDGCALDDEDRWQAANHSLGGTRENSISFSYVRQEREALPPREFGRERLGWHEAPASDGGMLDQAVWHDLTDVQSKRDGDVTCAVDIEPDRSMASIGLAGKRADGLWHVQLLDHRPGTDWIVARMAELRGQLDPVSWVMGGGTYRSLQTDLEREGFTVPDTDVGPLRGDLLVPKAAEMAAATGQFLDRVTQKALRHLGQQPLNVAAGGARARTVGDALAWSRKDVEVGLSPLWVVTLAPWGHEVRIDLVDQEVEPWAFVD